MNGEQLRAEFEAWYADAIWGNEDFKQALERAWQAGRAALQSQHDEETKNLRDALWVAERKLEALQSQGREDAFIDGVLLGLQVITGAGNAGNAEHDELMRSAGVDLVVRRAIEQEMWELAGLDSNQLAIDHARRVEGD